MIVTDCLLVAYADGELDPETSRRLEGLLTTAAELREKVEIFRQTAMLLRMASGTAAAPSAAPAPAAALRREPAQQADWRIGWAVAASLAAAIAGFGSGAFWVRAFHSETSELLDEIADYHPVYSRETAHMVEVAAARADEISVWLGGRIGRALAIPDLTPAGLAFAGGRLLVANGRPVAEFMYTRDQGLPVALCISRITGAATPLHVESRGALRLASWQDGDFAYVVAGELDESAARSIAARAAQQL